VILEVPYNGRTSMLGTDKKCFQAFMLLGRFCGRAVVYNMKSWCESRHVCSICWETFSCTHQWTNTVCVMCQDHNGSFPRLWLHLCIAWKTVTVLSHQVIALRKL